MAEEKLALDLSSKVAAPSTRPFTLGSSRSPSGHEIGADSRSLLYDGKPWPATMGEFHYSRYPKEQWRDELLKMKAGGIDIVASYVFWIHHEEVEGQWDWEGRRSLRDFVKTCADVGLPVLVRCGPWAHGEARNGGLPDWLVARKIKLRTEDPEFLSQTLRLYTQIRTQLDGLLWKEGGPVIGIQVDNEYHGPGEYLIRMKRLAQEAGLDVPIYTRTGWPETKTPVKFGEILPMFGAYAEGFWDRSLKPMPGHYWKAFIFDPGRTDTAVATDTLSERELRDAAETRSYPYLTCEMGGGMVTSYHRRIYMEPRDIEAVTLVKIGSGSNLPGYYMYHGGTNPVGKLTTLHESQATKYPNDLPVMSYDFQAPLGEYGQVREHFHSLRRLHMFIHDFGDTLLHMPASFPATRPTRGTDTATLRWAVRSDGNSGFVFVNNYQRLAPMASHPQTQFELKLASGAMTIPLKPVDIAPDTSFIWPFNLDLGGGATLAYATAQPVCHVDDGGTRTYVFAETPGVAAQFVFRRGVQVSSSQATVRTEGDNVICDGVKAGTDVAIKLEAGEGKSIQIVLLSADDSLRISKAKLGGKDRLFFTQATLFADGGDVRLTSDGAEKLVVGIYPTPTRLSGSNWSARPPAGIFGRFGVSPGTEDPSTLTVTQTKEAGPPREVRMGSQKVAEAPGDADFEQAAVWKIQIPAGLDLKRNPIVRIHYVGDVARTYVGEKLITDNFYNGREFDVGLAFVDGGIPKELTLKILPLRKDAPIYLNRPAEAQGDVSLGVSKIELIQESEARISLP